LGAAQLVQWGKAGGLMQTKLCIFGFVAAAGCSGNYQGALPSRSDVAINVPSPASTSTSSAHTEALLGAPATFYTMTYQLSTQLNNAAASFFDQIDMVVASPPSGSDATNTYWGPFNSALSPMTVMFAVQNVDANDYNFFLGGKPKGAPDSTTFTGLLGGSAHVVDAAHKSGQLEANFTAMNALDPTTNTSTGAIGFVHDNTADPRTVGVHFENFVGTPGSTPLTATYQYAEHPDTSGNFQYNLSVNFDNDPGNILEDATVVSRWLATGAGRADVIVQGGSLPAGFVVHATECWDASFVRVYYTEDVDPSKTEGNVADCALP
jgi:hypothetical protein